MVDVIEPASSGRAKCRGCGKPIAKSVLRFGERGPNPMGDGEATYWFHLECAAYRRPEPLAAILDGAALEPEQRESLASIAADGIEHPRLPRLARVERDPSGRARCRHCRTIIDRGTWRLALQMWEEGRFTPIGFIHTACAQGYFAREDLLERVRHSTPNLDEDDLAELTTLLAIPPAPAGSSEDASVPARPSDPENSDPTSSPLGAPSSGDISDPQEESP